MRAILLLVAVLISYGSLYPFNFSANGHWLRQGLLLFTQPDLHMGRGDLVGNLLLFAPYGFVATLLCRGQRHGRVTGQWVLLLALGLLLALVLQLAQLWLPSRVPALGDVVANAGGMLLGVAAALLAHQVAPAATGDSANLLLGRALAPAVLMLLWLGYQWFPLVPTIDLQNMINAVKPLVRTPQLDAVRALHTALAWLAFFKLWQLASGQRTPALALALAALCILGAKLVIVGASISLTNAVGLGLALACLPWRQHSAALPVLIIAMLVSLLASGLAPFALSDMPQAFHWIPFTGMLEGSMGVNLLNLVEKTYFYGALIVFMTANGARPVPAASAVAICLGAIEAAQVFMPNRVAETTDPILALIIGFVIGWLSPRRKPVRASA
ncbi:MAG: VanZ family protein [Proteobacteria bacterium]|nr:VanZ family protein [Pseudomonadota bacterium]